jgi:putative oligomerization/nucleic acid binding protein
MLRRGVGRVGRPGLIGTMARTAVVAGTATAVSGGVARRQHARWQQEADAQAPPPQAPPPAEAAPAAPPVDLVAQLQGLAALRDQGVLTQEEFDAQKARILAS